ncbi:MAG: HAD-IA family hydrolase, partial [Selenomonadaceae bacterium]|nr:HAD-IA family hydrolase [Selenomonadaceae bacterium]
MDKMLQAAINKAKVVSFDIFDTLIVRVYKKPVDLFRHLEESEMAPGFAKARVEGEAKARRKALENSKRKEVSLSEIYRAMGSKYAPFKEKEIALEKLACKQNPEMKAVFDECLAKGKRVIIASDMYLPHADVEEILKENGYTGYEKLFLSSDAMHPKASGDMYQDIVSYVGLPAEDILHIGDHPYTDVEMARKAGIRSYLYLPIRETKGNIPNAAYFAVLNRYEEKSLVPSLLEGLITLHGAQKPDESYWESFGYKYAGIMAAGYMKWLKNELDERSIRKVFFMMRDGYIFKKVFDRLYSGFDTKEIYGSRTMFMLAGMESYEDIKIHVTGIHREGLTYRRCYERLAIDNEELWAAYQGAFPDVDAVLQHEEDIEAVDGFFIEHENDLKKIGKEERKLLLKYFASIGLFDGKCAIVDLGWKCSMLKGIEKICRMEGKSHELLGFYLATHEFENKENVKFVCYAMEQGRSGNKMPYHALLNYGYVPAVMELMFTAPMPSTLKMQEKDGKIVPLYQESCPDEAARIKVSEEITKGVLAFLEDFAAIDGSFSLSVSGGAAILPMEYISEHIHKRDAHEISKLCTMPGTGRDSFSLPILSGGCCHFGVILTWPGDMSAELEVLNRIKQAARECGMICVPFDNHGHLLDDQGNRTRDFVDARNLDFVISMHYDSPKYLDAYYYFTIWNPPEIPLGVSDYGSVADRYISYDDYLIYDDGGMKNHLRSVLMNCPRDIEGASSLMASFPASAVMEPNLKDPKLFYCGMNWDVIMKDGSGRNEGVMKLLDKEGVLRIFGPDVNPAWHGIRPWEGYQCYQHPIPFDGFSILKELNDCGVCLVLSSDIHRRAGAVTNRAFEACAAGAVMISDDNPTMRKMFGDVALFIEFNRKDPQDTYTQILEKYQWILSHKKEAAEIARRAQKLFVEKYSLDVYLKNIVHRHAERFDA